jgi:hypothetical protein
MSPPPPPPHGPRRRRLAAVALVLFAAGLTLLLSLRGNTDDAGARAAEGSAGEPAPVCGVTVSTLAAVQSEVEAANPGSSVCLRDGT